MEWNKLFMLIAHIYLVASLFKKELEALFLIMGGLAFFILSLINSDKIIGK